MKSSVDTGENGTELIVNHRSWILWIKKNADIKCSESNKSVLRFVIHLDCYCIIIKLFSAGMIRDFKSIAGASTKSVSYDCEFTQRKYWTR